MSEARASAPDSPLRVGYILKMFPRLSETFILNELLELENQGIEASVFSLMFPGDGRYHGRLASLRLTVQHVTRDKAEGHWQLLRALPAELVPPMARWDEAADFLRRHDIPKDFELLMRAVRIAAEVKRQGIQHLHAHFATIATRVAAMVNMLTGVPFSFTSHAKDIFRETVNRELYAELVDRAAFNITVSDFNRAYLLEKTPGVDADKVIRLYNGIDLNYFRPPEQPPSSRIPHLLSVGRLVPKKGFDHLLNALSLWKTEGKHFRATIIGDGESRDELHEQCSSLGLDGDVEFTGGLPQEEVRRRLASSDIAVLACVPDELGNMDALPTTLLEALATGVPVVSTRLTGVPEIVGDVGGVVVEPASPRALADGLQTMLQRVRSGQFSPTVARKRAEELFDLRANAGTLAGHFAASVKNTPSGNRP